MAYYKDMREYLDALEGADLLVRVDRKINKDTELNPLVRLQFRGLPESHRKAFLFTNVTDLSGRNFSIPVVVGCLAASRQIYGMGLQCDPNRISQEWTKARENPIEPVAREQRARARRSAHEERVRSDRHGLGGISHTDFYTRIRRWPIYHL